MIILSNQNNDIKIQLLFSLNVIFINIIFLNIIIF